MPQISPAPRHMHAFLSLLSQRTCCPFLSTKRTYPFAQGGRRQYALCIRIYICRLKGAGLPRKILGAIIVTARSMPATAIVPSTICWMFSFLRRFFAACSNIPISLYYSYSYEIGIWGLSPISRKERGERKGVQKDFQCPLLALDRLLGGVTSGN